MSYDRLGAMIATSAAMMFGLIYLNTYELGHVFYSETAHERRIVATALVAFVLALWLVRSQETVEAVSYMRAMIPHHSIAILTSARTHIRDPRVRALADQIIESQLREIGEMKRLIGELERNPTPEGTPDLPHYQDRGPAKRG